MNCPCDEAESFFCKHLQRRMTPHLAALCRDEPGRRKLYESRRDNIPRKPAAKPVGWGDRLETTLTKMGITQERYVAVKEKFGLPPDCNCDARKAWLNKVEQWVKATLVDLTDGPVRGAGVDSED